MNTLKKIFYSSASVLALSFILWITLLLNPNLSYANQTTLDHITIYHNQALESTTVEVVQNAFLIIQDSEIYDKDIHIQVCLNDDNIYPHLYPFAGATAYAFLNKTVIYHSEPNFQENYTAFKWEVNNYETRKYNLTSLLAHEFMHNLQSNFDAYYYIKSTLGKPNWKLEGHAEYISRRYKNDNQLDQKILHYLTEIEKDHSGIPVLILKDQTIQNLSYFKYSLIIQYLMEIQKRTFTEICDLELSLDELYLEMINWHAQLPR